MSLHSSGKVPTCLRTSCDIDGGITFLLGGYLSFIDLAPSGCFYIGEPDHLAIEVHNERSLKLKSSKMEYYDYLIIGAGPGGLQIGYFLEKRQRKYLILEAGDSAGTFFKTFPRHRTLISSNKVYTGITNSETNLRWDWNSLLSDEEELVFHHYSKKYFPPANDLIRYLDDFARHCRLNIQYNTKVTSVTKEDKFVVLDHQDRIYSCKYLIIATGRFIPHIPRIPGVELAENYTTVSTRSEDFSNQRVMIIGKGNSAFETAESMIETSAVIHLTSPNPV